MGILEVNNVHFAYPDGYKVLHGIDLKINKGEIVALLGANGCGKTTLLQQLNGLLKPQQGIVKLNDRALNQLKDLDIFRTVGLVFQDPNDQLFASTVYEDVSYGPTNLGLTPAEVNQRVERSLKLVDMWQHKHKSIHHLSYGQKKKVAIAGILALEPELMVMDEPTAGLDPRGVSSLMKLLLTIRQETGCSILISTHHVDLVPIYCERVYVMEEGRIILKGTPQEVFTDRQSIRKAGLRLPRIAHLGEIMNKDGYVIDSLPLTISQARGMVKKLLNDRGTTGGGSDV